jgi:hypothetical protein
MAPKRQTMVMRAAKPLAPRREYVSRIVRGFAIGGTVVGAGLAIGAAGYHVFEGLPWLDATLNASMLLAGEGPLAPPHTTGGKVFATVYALFSGVIFVTAIGVLLAPVVHRFLHRFHLDIVSDDEVP